MSLNQNPAPVPAKTLASYLPDRKIWAGGISAVLAWFIISFASPLLAKYGVPVPSDAQAQLAGLIGLLIAWGVPPSDQDIITRMNNRLVAMANVDDRSAVSLPQARTAAPPAAGSTVPVAPAAAPAPPPAKLSAHVWPVLALLPVILALAGCDLGTINAAVTKYAPIAGKNLVMVGNIIVQAECSPLNGATTAAANALSLKAPNSANVQKAANALSANLAVAEQLCPLVAAIQTSVGAIPVGSPSIVVPVATGG